jgi:hypothetical protein
LLRKMDKPPGKKPQQGKKPKKIKQYVKKDGITVEEFERRLKQRENAMLQRIKKTSSPAVGQFIQKSGATLRGTQAVLGSLIDPEAYDPVRLANGGKETFVLRLKRVLSATTSSTLAVSLTPNSTFLVARRDVRCSLIYHQYQMSGSQASTYQANSPGGLTTLNVDENGFAVVGAMSYSSGWARHEAWQIPWVFADGSTRVWFQSEAATPSTIAFNTLAVTTSYTFTANFVLNGVYSIRQISASTNASGAYTWNFNNTPIAGYVAVSVVLNSTSAIVEEYGYYLQDNSVSAVRHLAAPSFWTQLASIDSLRINSASLMFGRNIWGQLVR